MMGEDVQHSFTLIGSHIIESLSPLLSHYLSFILFLSVTPSFCVSMTVFSGNSANPMTLDAESLAYTI